MKTNGEDLVNQSIVKTENNDNSTDNLYNIVGNGLTKRELMAIEFTKSIVTGIYTGSASRNEAHGWPYSEFASEGLRLADALINELNK